MGEYFVRSLEPNVSLKKKYFVGALMDIFFWGWVRWRFQSFGPIILPLKHPPLRREHRQESWALVVATRKQWGFVNILVPTIEPRSETKWRLSGRRAGLRAAPVTALDKYRAWPLNLTHPWPHGAPWSLQWHLSRPLQVPGRAFDGTSRNFTMPGEGLVERIRIYSDTLLNRHLNTHSE